MSRRARVGRQPAVQQSVTSTLVSIARQMQASRDSNIMDAWKNGGEFEGHKVTDDMALAYWKKRESGLDPKDPGFDTAQTQIMQLQYGIEQSKADLQHVQGKINDQQYAQFFIKWAAKVPKNGEFWRVLQKDAASLMESAKSKAKSNADKAKQDAFNLFTEGKNKDINVGNALTKALGDIAGETGLDLEANGDRLLELLGADYAKNPDKYRVLADAIKVNGGGFNGTFTHAWAANQIAQASAAYGDVATRAHKDGYATAYSQASGGQSSMASWGADLKVWSPAQVYDQAYSAFQKVWGDPNASYRDKADAAKVFSGVATKLSTTPGISTASSQMFAADAARALGQPAGDVPSFGPTMLGAGHAGIDPKIEQTVAMTTQAQMMMDQTPGAYVYASMSPDGTFDSSGKAPVGIIPVGSMPKDVVFVAVPGLNGKPSMVAVQPHDVVVNDPNDPKASPTVIGKTVSYQVGGSTVTMYGIQDRNGNASWVLRSPYADGVTGATDKSGNLVLTLPGVADPAARAAQIDAKYGTNLVDQLKHTPGASGVSSVIYQRDPATNKVTAKMTVKFDGSGFSATQSAYTLDPNTGLTVEGNAATVGISVNTPQELAAAVVAPSVLSGGVKDGYLSPVAASIGAADSTMASSQVASLAQDPSFQHAFVNQTMQTLGIQNPLDPRIASAWDSATSKASDRPVGSYGDPSSISSRARTDLSYPGTATQDPAHTQATITFGGQNLKLPGLPAYLNNAQGQAPSLNMDTMFKGGAKFADSVLQPGQQPGMPATPGGTITPTQTPTPTTAPAPTPTPTPTPTTAPPSNGDPSSIGSRAYAPPPPPPPPITGPR